VHRAQWDTTDRFLPFYSKNEIMENIIQGGIILFAALFIA